jgi:hypothetical protein
MSVRVIIPPEPIVTPADIAGPHAGDDAGVARVIMAAQRTIDGPQGWLGIAIGPQTLELTSDAYCEMRLPCPPLIEIEGINYLDEDDAEQVVDDGDFRLIPATGVIWFRSGFAFPSTNGAPDAVRIRYRAGYDGADVDSGGTGPVPDEAKQAVIVLAQHMLSTGAANLFLRSEEVEGIGTRQFVVSDQADAVIERTVRGLLQGLRVYR